MCSSFLLIYRCSIMLSFLSTYIFQTSEKFVLHLSLRLNYLQIDCAKTEENQTLLRHSEPQSSDCCTKLVSFEHAYSQLTYFSGQSYWYRLKPTRPLLLYCTSIMHILDKQLDKEDHGKSPPLSVFHAKLKILGISLKSRTSNKWGLKRLYGLCVTYRGRKKGIGEEPWRKESLGRPKRTG